MSANEAVQLASGSVRDDPHAAPVLGLPDDMGRRRHPSNANAGPTGGGLARRAAVAAGHAHAAPVLRSLTDPFLLGALRIGVDVLERTGESADGILDGPIDDRSRRGDDRELTERRRNDGAGAHNRRRLRSRHQNCASEGTARRTVMADAAPPCSRAASSKATLAYKPTIPLRGERTVIVGRLRGKRALKARPSLRSQQRRTAVVRVSCTRLTALPQNKDVSTNCLILSWHRRAHFVQ